MMKRFRLPDGTYSPPHCLGACGALVEQPQGAGTKWYCSKRCQKKGAALGRPYVIRVPLSKRRREVKPNGN